MPYRLVRHLTQINVGAPRAGHHDQPGRLDEAPCGGPGKRPWWARLAGDGTTPRENCFRGWPPPRWGTRRRWVEMGGHGWRVW